MTTLLKTSDGTFCCDIYPDYIRVYEADFEEANNLVSLYAAKHNLSYKYAAYNTTAGFHHFTLTK